jgi:hypothetical protein
MSVNPQTPRASGGLAPLAPYQGSALDPLGTLSGPRPLSYSRPPNHKSWIRPCLYGTYILRLDLQLSVPITTNVVSSNFIHGSDSTTEVIYV